MVRRRMGSTSFNRGKCGGQAGVGAGVYGLVWGRQWWTDCSMLRSLVLSPLVSKVYNIYSVPENSIAPPCSTLQLWRCIIAMLYFPLSVSGTPDRHSRLISRGTLSDGNKPATTSRAGPSTPNPGQLALKSPKSERQRTVPRKKMENISSDVDDKSMHSLYAKHERPKTLRSSSQERCGFPYGSWSQLELYITASCPPHLLFPASGLIMFQDRGED